MMADVVSPFWEIGLAYQFNFNIVCIDKNGVTPVKIEE
jgi:hypothetical protein